MKRLHARIEDTEWKQLSIVARAMGLTIDEAVGLALRLYVGAAKSHYGIEKIASAATANETRRPKIKRGTESITTNLGDVLKGIR